MGCEVRRIRLVRDEGIPRDVKSESTASGRKRPSVGMYRTGLECILVMAPLVRPRPVSKLEGNRGNIRSAKMTASRIGTTITVCAASAPTGVLPSLSTRIEGLRRSFVIALRVIFSASTICIGGIATSCAAPFLASTASPTARRRHSRDSITGCYSCTSNEPRPSQRSGAGAGLALNTTGDSIRELS